MACEGLVDVVERDPELRATLERLAARRETGLPSGGSVGSRPTRASARARREGIVKLFAKLNEDERFDNR